MSCVSLWADEISHTQHTTHIRTCKAKTVHGNPRWMATQRAGLGNVLETLGGNNLPNSCICTFDTAMVDFIDVVVLSCDLASMKIFPRARLGLPSNKLCPYMPFTQDNCPEGAKSASE